MELLPIYPLSRELWPVLTDEQFAEMNENVVWVLQNATDIHGELLTVEERNALIREYNDFIVIVEGCARASKLNMAQ
jgi:hypothetical protein